MKLVTKVKREHQDPRAWLVLMGYLEKMVFLEKMVCKDSSVHLVQVESKVSRGKEAFLDYLETWFRKKAYEEKREMPDLQGLPGLMDTQGLLVLLVLKVYLEALANSARGERKVKVDCRESMAFLDLLALKVHLVHRETKDILDPLVCLVKSDFLANPESLENLGFLVKMAWTVFLEVTVLRGPGESEGLMGFLESLGLRVTKGLLDQEGPQEREEKLVYLDREVLMGQEEKEGFQERGGWMDPLGLREKKATRVK